MKLRVFFVILFAYIVLVGLYVFSINGDKYLYTLPLSSYEFSLPVAIWFIIPVLIFAIIVFFLELGANFQAWIQSRLIKEDFKLLLDQIQAELLEKEFHALPKTRRYKTLSILLGNLELSPKVEMSKKTGDSSLDSFLESLGDIKRGNYIDLKKYSPNLESNIAKQNFSNRLNEDEKFAQEVLRDGRYTATQKQEAFRKLLQRDNEKEVKKYLNSITLDESIAHLILNTCKEKKIAFSSEEILSLCGKTDFTYFSQNDYIALAKYTKEYFMPQQWIELFEALANKNEKAEAAYCYVLLDLEMIDATKERLANTSIEDKGLMKLKAYLDLKESGKNYALDLFFT